MDIMFETDRLIIRKFEMKDCYALFINHLDEEVKMWFPNESYADMEESKEAVGFYIDRVTENKLPFVLAVELKETGELIGDTGINQVEENSNQIEIGYVIFKDHRGKGYATELLQVMTEFISTYFNISAIYARVLDGNQASVRVLEKNG